ncbi:MAG: murein biosynthesis integral membrane protein MurJ [Acidimicrobiia bacterium]
MTGPTDDTRELVPSGLGTGVGARTGAEVDGPAGAAPGPAPVAAGRRGSIAVAAGILASRLAGLVREVAISGYLGVGATADAFKAALRIPNLFQNLLGEGVLSASFIPVYAKLLDEDEEEAGRVAGAVAGMLCALTAVLVVLGMLLARPLTVVLTPGFEGERLDLATDLLRIMFPGLGLLVGSAWCLGVLNSHRRFFLAYVAPVLWNAGQVVVLVAAGVAGATQAGLATALAWGVVLGSALEVAIQLPTVLQLVGRVRLSLEHRSAPVRSVLSRFVPVVVGRGVVQLLTYVDLVLASLLAVGAVSGLTYAQVLYLLPISLFGMSVAAAELPELSRLGAAGRVAIRERLTGGLDRISFYVAPTVAIYLVAGDVVVGTLLQRGEFDAADTRLVWFTLGAFSLGLLGTTRSRLLQNGLYALNRPRLVARIAVLRVAVAAAIGAVLMFPLDRWAIVGPSVERMGDLGFGPLPEAVRSVLDGPPRLGVIGLALGAAISSWIEFRLLHGALQWRIGRFETVGPATRAALVAAGAIAVLAAGIRSVTHDLPSLVGAAVVLVPAGATYLAITTSFGVPEAAAIVGRARALVGGSRGARPGPA